MIKFETASSRLSAKINSLPETDTEALLPEEVKKILPIMAPKDRNDFNFYMAHIIAKKSSQENEIGLQNWLREGVVDRIGTGHLRMSEIIDLSNRIYAAHLSKKPSKSNRQDDYFKRIIELLIQISRELAFQ
ncbi:hypothetical protein [Oligoflexus tunisiensis]|uniref:hypothetical protein n=1 Tax=Oligoflexus tunisiensis TaxID=708132 RepID=UPI00114D3A33|nr:hypothetical protein [Oligoflexus tunisiensis]